jgi:hypothetical protein
MSGHLFLGKEAFVPCESHPAACDFGLLYVESPFGNSDRWTRHHGDGKCVQEKTLSACNFFFLCPDFGYMKYIKAIPLQAWTGPDGSRKLRLPDSRQSAHEGVKVVSPTHRPPLPPRKYSTYRFLLEPESTPRAIVRPEGLFQ